MSTIYLIPTGNHHQTTRPRCGGFSSFATCTPARRHSTTPLDLLSALQQPYSSFHSRSRLERAQEELQAAATAFYRQQRRAEAEAAYEAHLGELLRERARDVQEARAREREYYLRAEREQQARIQAALRAEEARRIAVRAEKERVLELRRRALARARAEEEAEAKAEANAKAQAQAKAATQTRAPEQAESHSQARERSEGRAREEEHEGAEFDYVFAQLLEGAFASFFGGQQEEVAAAGPSTVPDKGKGKEKEVVEQPPVNAPAAPAATEPTATAPAVPSAASSEHAGDSSSRSSSRTRSRHTVRVRDVDENGDEVVLPQDGKEEEEEDAVLV